MARSYGSPIRVEDMQKWYDTTELLDKKYDKRNPVSVEQGGTGTQSLQEYFEPYITKIYEQITDVSITVEGGSPILNCTSTGTYQEINGFIMFSVSIIVAPTSSAGNNLLTLVMPNMPTPKDGTVILAGTTVVGNGWYNGIIQEGSGIVALINGANLSNTYSGITFDFFGLYVKKGE